MVRWIGLVLMTPKTYNDDYRKREKPINRLKKRTYKLENKIVDFFYLGQNKCHSTGEKKFYFCHIFHLRPKKLWVGWVRVIIG